MTRKRDATIRGVWLTLTHHRQYASGIQAAMRKCIDQQGSASVRIGRHDINHCRPLGFAE